VRADVRRDEGVQQGLDGAGAFVGGAVLGDRVRVVRLRVGQGVGEQDRVVDTVDGQGSRGVADAGRVFRFDRRAGQQDAGWAGDDDPGTGLAQRGGEGVFDGEFQGPGADVVVQVVEFEVEVFRTDQAEPGQVAVADLDGDVG
jgi:hypothetical protein